MHPRDDHPADRLSTALRASFDALWLSHTLRPNTLLRPGGADVVSLWAQGGGSDVMGGCPGSRSIHSLSRVSQLRIKERWSGAMRASAARLDRSVGPKAAPVPGAHQGGGGGG